MANSNKDLYAFSPADITLYVAGKPLRSVLSVQYSISRQVAGLFGFGDPNAVAFNKGKRGIAGSIVCNVYQDHPFIRSDWAHDLGVVNKDNSPKTLAAFGASAGSADMFKASLEDYAFTNGIVSFNSSPNFSGASFSGLTDASLQKNIQAAYNFVGNRKVNYVDQLPAMDLTMAFVNEAGDAAYMTIHGLILINESGAFSMEDLTSEQAFTFVARSITPLTSFTPGRTGTQLGTQSFNINGVR